MNGKPTEWTLDGFVEHFNFVHHQMLDHKFVWMLGAGASLASNIPVGSQLVDRWLKTMHVREGSKAPIEKWATAEQLKITGFTYENRASFYPRIYERCFSEYPEEGYETWDLTELLAFAKKKMIRKDSALLINLAREINTVKIGNRAVTGGKIQETAIVKNAQKNSVQLPKNLPKAKAKRKSLVKRR